MLFKIYHSFHDEVNLYKTHWWRCDGPCQNRPPYFGFVKRAMNRAPSERDPWWNDHRQKCNGKFIKIKEPEGYGQKKNKGKKEMKSPGCNLVWLPLLWYARLNAIIFSYRSQIVSNFERISFANVISKSFVFPVHCQNHLFQLSPVHCFYSTNSSKVFCDEHSHTPQVQNQCNLQKTYINVIFLNHRKAKLLPA